MIPFLLIVTAACMRGQPGTTPAPHAPAAATSAEFMLRLERVDATMATVSDIRADFEQRKQTVLLKKPLVSRGRLLGKADTVLWETREPQPMSMLVTNDEVSMYYPADTRVEIYRLDARFREAAGGPLPRLAPLKERFELNQLDPREVGVVGATDGLLCIGLSPKTDELRRHIRSVRVLIDERVPCATRVIITDPDGEQTEIRFSNVRINTGMADTELKLNLPHGVRISRPIPDAPPAQPPTGAPHESK